MIKIQELKYINQEFLKTTQSQTNKRSKWIYGDTETSQVK